MKPIEIVLRKGGSMRENNGGVNLVKEQKCKHIWKYHIQFNNTLLYN
jgi:hypothetical protein